MASIASSLDYRKETGMRGFFSRPVRFHLLYRSSHHGASIRTLLSRFDRSGKYVIAVFLQSGVVRGGFTSNSLKDGGQFADEEAFVFEIGANPRKFNALRTAKAVEAHFTDSAQSTAASTATPLGGLHGTPATVSSFWGQAQFGSPSPPSPLAVSFGKCLRVSSDDHGMHVDFGADTTYSCTWKEEKNARCVDVELHRVEELEDFLPKPWRELCWTDETKKRLREDFVSCKLVEETLPRVRALILGPVGSGKSSLINSVRSTMYRRVIHLPNVGTTKGSFTKKLKSYDIHTDKGGSPTALTMCDVMAIGDEDFAGVSFSDILAIVKGHIPEGYQFQSDFPITEKVNGYKATPTLMDQVHCVLFVLSASKVESYSSGLQNTLRKLHTTVSDMGVPQLILLTHVDQVCCTVHKDVKSVYSSRAVQDKMQKAAELVGLPLSYVLPVRNYISQLTVDRDTDILLLSAVNTILQAVDDTLEDQVSVFLRPLTPVHQESSTTKDNLSYAGF